MAELLIAHGARLNVPAAVALDRDVDRVLREYPGALAPGGSSRHSSCARPSTRPVSSSNRSCGRARIRTCATTRRRRSTARSATRRFHAAAFNGNREAVEVLLHTARMYAPSREVSRNPGRLGELRGSRRHSRSNPARAHRHVRRRALRPGRPLSRIFDQNPGAFDQRLGRLLPKNPVDETPNAWWTPLAFAVESGKARRARAARDGSEIIKTRTAGRFARSHSRTVAKISPRLLDQYAPELRRRKVDRRVRVARRSSRFIANACPDHQVRGQPHIVAKSTAEHLLAQHPICAREHLHRGGLRRFERSAPHSRQRSGGSASQRRAEGSRGAEGERFTEARPASNPKAEPILYLASRDSIMRRRTTTPLRSRSCCWITAPIPTPTSWQAGAGFAVHWRRRRRESAATSKRDELALLLERGAMPYDIQVLYNIHFNKSLPHSAAHL